MDGDRNRKTIDLDDIAEEFKLPFIRDLIAYNQKVSVNMNHVSGWFESEGERFLFSPSVEFHPLENDEGFKLMIFDVELIEEGMESVGVYTFQKSAAEPGFRVALDDEGYILEERTMIPSDECDYELECYPATGAAGYDNNPFKILDLDPTLQ